MSHRATPFLSTASRDTYQAVAFEDQESPEQDVHGPLGPLVQKTTSASRAYSKASRVSKEREEVESEWRRKGKEMLAGTTFQLLLGLVIFTNAIVIGFETDYPDWECWSIVEMIFLVVFAIELALRLIIVGPFEFFSWEHPDFIWNVFDTVIVSLGVFDAALTASAGHSRQHSNATLFRITKLFRLLRVLRIFKILRFLKQLYILVYGFADAAQAVFWVTVLMTFSLYICSIVLVKVVGRPGPDDPDGQFWEVRFGSIQTSMFTLFELMSVPDLHPYHGKLNSHPIVGLFFIAFIIFGSCGMIALLTGVISESMFEKNQVRAEEERMEKDAKRLYIADRCREIYYDYLNDMAGKVTKAEIMKISPSVLTLMDEHCVGCTERDLAALINVLDSTSEAGVIDCEHFVRAIMSLMEGVSPLSIMELAHSLSQTRLQLNAYDGLFQSILTKLEANTSLVQDVKTVCMAASGDASAQIGRGLDDVSGKVAAAQTVVLQKHDELAASLARCEAAAADTVSRITAELRKDICTLSQARKAPLVVAAKASESGADSEAAQGPGLQPPPPPAEKEPSASMLESLASQIEELAIGQQVVTKEITQHVADFTSTMRQLQPQPPAEGVPRGEGGGAAAQGAGATGAPRLDAAASASGDAQDVWRGRGATQLQASADEARGDESAPETVNTRASPQRDDLETPETSVSPSRS